MTFKEVREKVSASEFEEWMTFFKCESHPTLLKPKQKPEDIKAALMAIAAEQNKKAKKKAPPKRVKKKAPPKKMAPSKKE